MTPIANVVYTTKERLHAALYEREISAAAVCREMGRGTSYISEQLRGLGGIALSVALFLAARYGIKREEYEIVPEQTPADLRRPVSGVAIQMDLCPSCYYSLLHIGFVRKVSWLDHELTCGRCHRHGYGGTYEVLRRREGTQ